MSEDRHEQKAQTLIAEWKNTPWAGDTADWWANLAQRLAAALRERDAKLEQAEAERDACRNLVACLNRDGGHRQVEVGMKQAAKEAEARAVSLIRDNHALVAAIQQEKALSRVLKGTNERLAAEKEALRAAIQRGYCPDPTCSYIGSPVDVGDEREHSPDCRVAPLLGGGKE